MDKLAALRPRPMSREDFRRELQRVAPSPIVAAKVLGVPPEQIVRWSSGLDEVPEMAMYLLLNYLPAEKPEQLLNVKP